MKDDKNISINIDSGAILKVILLLIGFYAIWFLRDIVLVVLTSVVIASAIEPFVSWFQKRRVPRVLGVIAVYLVVVIVAGLIFYLFLPTLITDTVNLLNALPGYVESIQLLNPFGQVGDLSESEVFSELFSFQEIISRLSSSVSSASVGFFSTLSTVFGGILSFVLIIVLSFYLAVQEKGVENFIRLVTPLKHEAYLIDLWHRSQKKIGLWMQGQLLLGVIVGVLTYLGLSILGVPNAMFLALVAAVLELIPVIGPTLSAVPALVIALFDGGLTLALLVLGLYVIIQQFESNLIYPLVVKKVVGIPSIISILMLIIGAKVAGFIGIILSIPVASVVMELLSDFEKSKHKTQK